MLKVKAPGYRKRELPVSALDGAADFASQAPVGQTYMVSDFDSDAVKGADKRGQ
jgi:hypothetical protein